MVSFMVKGSQRSERKRDGPKRDTKAHLKMGSGMEKAPTSIKMAQNTLENFLMVSGMEKEP